MKQKIIFWLLATLLATGTLRAKTERLTIQGSKGKLATILIVPDEPQGQKIPLVIICHGFTGNKDEPLLRLISDSLCRWGIASLRFDFNGHGESEGKFSEMTVPNELEDVWHMYEYASALPFVSRIGMVGHSQGGVVTAMISGRLGHRHIRAAALLAPAAVLRDDALRGQLMGQRYDPHHLPEQVSLWGNLAVGRAYLETAQTLPIYETARQYKGATFVVHGTWDTLVPYTYGERFAHEMRRAKLLLIPQADHGFNGHQQDVAGRVAAWMAKKL